jgi:hypothetical protein
MSVHLMPALRAEILSSSEGGVRHRATNVVVPWQMMMVPGTRTQCRACQVLVLFVVERK